MHGEWMVVLIVAIVMVASVFKHRAKLHHQAYGDGNGQARVENQRLREEVQELKERIKVLERITVEKENSLSRQIEELRDR